MRNPLFPVTEGEVIRIVEIASGSGITEVPLVGELFLFARDKDFGKEDSDGIREIFTSVASGTGAFIQTGKVSFGAGVTSVAVSFPRTYSAVPTMLVTMESAGVVQAGGVDNLTANGFTFRRSSAAGAVTGHWLAIGVT